MTICSVQEYINLIEKLKNNYTYTVSSGSGFWATTSICTPHFIFRGHSNYKAYKLLPGVIRCNINPEGGISGYLSTEYNILFDFISEACRFVNNVSVEDIAAWLEIAQHFGVPTRLLDFTENPLVALYFACSSSVGVDACVWILNEPAYNKKFFLQDSIVQTAQSQVNVNSIIMHEIINRDSKLGDLQYIQWPWIYKPLYREERMHLQSSMFMMWGAQRGALTDFIDKNDYMVDENVTNSDHGIICSIMIPADKKKEILQQLNLLGINEKFIYPGMDGVGKYINNKYKYSTKGNLK